MKAAILSAVLSGVSFSVSINSWYLPRFRPIHWLYSMWGRGRQPVLDGGFSCPAGAGDDKQFHADLSLKLQRFAQTDLFLRPAFFCKAMAQKQPDRRIVNGKIVIQNGNAILLRGRA